MNQQDRILCLDMSNLLYRTFYANKSDDDVTIAGLAHHMALTTMNKYYKTFKPTKMILTFDKPNWRKEYTKSDKCVSKKIYKGNRRQKMTPKEKEKYTNFINHLTEFEIIMKEHSSAIVLSANKLEADDLMAGVAQLYSMEGNNEVIIVSGDGDIKQLLRYDNVRVINPANGKDQDLSEWNNDADLFMFEKCIRGDRGDNVQSALPYVKKTKIWKAYNDPLARANLMHETWINPTDGREMVVKKLYDENKLLMDLTCQPEDIQQLIFKNILQGINNPGKFSYFHFMQFLGKYEMKKIADQAEIFTPMLSC